MTKLARISIAATALSLAAFCQSPRFATAADPVVVIDWTDPYPPALQKKVRNRIRVLASKVVYNPDDNVAYKAVKGLALLQALPFLEKSPPTGVISHGAALANAKKLFNEVASVVYPEYYPELTGTGAALASPSLSVVGLRDLLVRPKTLGGQEVYQVNYAIPFILMQTEMVCSGGFRAKPFGVSTTADDTAPRSFFKPANPALRLGVARAACLLLSAGGRPDETEPTKNFHYRKLHYRPNPGSIWEYGYFGESPAKSCLSKSSTALFGIRAAVNLGVLDYEEPKPPKPSASPTVEDSPFAFKFDDADTTAVTRQGFLDRLNDVLWHSVLALSDLETPATGPIPEANHVGVVGADALRRLQAAPVAAPSVANVPTDGLDIDAMANEPIDLTRYCYQSAALGGRAVIRVQLEPARPGLGTPYVAYRYLPGHGGYKAYHTAGGAFVLASSIGMIRQLCDEMSPGEKLGHFYPIERLDENSWRLTNLARGDVRPDRAALPLAAGRTFAVTPDDELRYAKLRVLEEIPSAQPIPIDDRVAQSLNAAIAMMTRRTSAGDASPRSLNRQPGANKIESWQSRLTLSKSERQFVGMAFYGLVKGALGTHRDHAYALGPWFWWRDLAEELCEADYILTAPPTHANIELSLLCLTRSFRPTFPRPE